MVKSILLGIFLLFQLPILTQEIVVTGKITNSNGEPLIGALVCQYNTDNCTNSDYNGLFHLLIDEEQSKQLRIAGFGYKTLILSNIDTITGLLKIELPISDFNDSEHQEYLPRRKLKYGFIQYFQVDFIFNDFDDFRTLLKDYNVDLMDKSNGIFSVELAGTYKKYYAGFNFGFANDGVYDHESLDIEFNTRQYGLHFGYNILNTKRLLATPKVAVKWNRYRLLNNDKEKKIPIEQYVIDRDLDLRFNQMTGFVGLNLSYKMYKFNFLPTDYWTMGLYGGYAFKMNDKPIIYSQGNRLTGNDKIGIENYNIGVHFSFNFEGQ